MEGKVIIKIKRQLSQNDKPYYEFFSLPITNGLNIISALIKIQKNPITVEGKITEPVNWECSCLEEVCGSCTMLVNGKVRQACTALVKNIVKQTGSNTITLEPLTKFPIVRDLQVDRQKMFNNLIQVKGWTPLDGYFHHQEVVISRKKFTDHELSQIKLENVGFDEKTKTIENSGSYITRDLGSNQNPKTVDLRYILSTCMTCGCCVEACPQTKNHSNAFMGAFAISQVRYFNLHPEGEYMKEERLEALMKPNGISNCGNAQLCVKVCPKNIPLTESIVDIMRATTKHGFFGWFNK